MFDKLKEEQEALKAKLYERLLLEKESLLSLSKKIGISYTPFRRFMLNKGGLNWANILKIKNWL
jgi:hypothetical protein